MKKAAALIIIVALMLSSSACGLRGNAADATPKAMPGSDSSASNPQNAVETQPDKLASPGLAADKADTPGDSEADDNTINLKIGNTIFTATLEDNSSAEALKELLAAGPLTIDMTDYGNMEKVGELGTNLPTNNEQITTEPGDLILYQGNAFVIYYAPNSWNLTRLGKINDATGDELKEALGSGDVAVTLSLNPN